jgi:HK97 family phage portal protein
MARFYRNGAQPSGVLSGPGQIDPDTAKRIEDKWDGDFTGENSGKIAVLGSGLEFKSMSANVVASDIVDQLKYSGSEVATCFSVPLYKVGLMDQPRAINNIQALQVEYFGQALQVLVEGIERNLSDALALSSNLRVMLDVDNLLRMDGLTKAELWGTLTEKGIAAPNEARAAFDLPPVAGGEAPFLQQQNWPISALAGRGVAPSGTTPPEPKSVILRP